MYIYIYVYPKKYTQINNQICEVGPVDSPPGPCSEFVSKLEEANSKWCTSTVYPLRKAPKLGTYTSWMIPNKVDQISTLTRPKPSEPTPHSVNLNSSVRILSSQM